MGTYKTDYPITRIMKFYAYIPKEGKEPVGTDNRILFELKTIKGAIRRCKSVFGNKEFRLFTYSNFYDDSTFKQVN